MKDLSALDFTAVADEDLDLLYLMTAWRNNDRSYLIKRLMRVLARELQRRGTIAKNRLIHDDSAFSVSDFDVHELTDAIEHFNNCYVIFYFAKHDGAANFCKNLVDLLLAAYEKNREAGHA